MKPAGLSGLLPYETVLPVSSEAAWRQRFTTLAIACIIAYREFPAHSFSCSFHSLCVSFSGFSQISALFTKYFEINRIYYTILIG
jgi:hypothetical protein